MIAIPPSLPMSMPTVFRYQRAGRGERGSHDDGERRLDRALAEDHRQHLAGRVPDGLEHPELPDALEDGHQHGVEDQDADGHVDDKEDDHHHATRRLEHGGQRG